MDAIITAGVESDDETVYYYKSSLLWMMRLSDIKGVHFH